MKALVERVNQWCEKFWTWPPLARASCAMLLLLLVLVGAFELFKLTPCVILCRDFNILMKVTLDQMAFKIEPGGSVGFLEGVRFQELEVSDLQSVRWSGGDLAKNVELSPTREENSVSLSRKSGSIGGSFVNSNAGYSGEPINGVIPPELGNVRFYEGTKIIIRGYSPGDATLHLSARAKAGSESHERTIIATVFPRDSTILLRGRNLSNAARLPEYCSKNAKDMVLVCEAQLGSNLVEIVPDPQRFSILVKLAAANGQGLKDLVLTHAPIRASEFDFGRLDEKESLLTTVRSGEIKLLDYAAIGSFNLLASDLVLVPRDAILQVKDLRIKEDGSISAVIEGYVRELRVGWMLEKDGKGMKPNRIVISVADWLLSTEWAKNTLWAALGTIIPGILIWVWQGRNPEAINPVSPSAGSVDA